MAAATPSHIHSQVDAPPECHWASDPIWMLQAQASSHISATRHFCISSDRGATLILHTVLLALVLGTSTHYACLGSEHDETLKQDVGYREGDLVVIPW